MDLFVYSDESGVFDKAHNEIFVFGGLIFIGKDQKDEYARRYIAAEKVMRGCRYSTHKELKACRISNKDKGKLYRATNGTVRFGVLINQQKVLPRIFESKKDKQRYLDYAYKIGLKRALEYLISEEYITRSDVNAIHIYNDEHTTATNGRYELREAIENELEMAPTMHNITDFLNLPSKNLRGWICFTVIQAKRLLFVRQIL